MERIKNIGKSKKFGRTLREQNAKRYGIDNQTLKGLESFYCRTDTDKFTIVELLFRGRRYHGLSAKSDQDISNLTEGIAHAYSRAFDNMVLDIPHTTSYCNKQDIMDIISKDPISITIGKTISQIISKAENKVDEKINIGDPLIIKQFSDYDVYIIKCLHCGKTSNYFAKTFGIKTKCPACGRRLSEPATHTKFLDISEN